MEGNIYKGAGNLSKDDFFEGWEKNQPLIIFILYYS